MQNYERLIYESLRGDTPREKYEHLKSLLKFASDVGFPSRGSAAERWDIIAAAEVAQQLVDQDGGAGSVNDG